LYGKFDQFPFDSQHKCVRVTQQPSVLHSSSDLSELSQWLCGLDDSTINVVLVIIIIIFTIGRYDPEELKNYKNIILLLIVNVEYHNLLGLCRKSCWSISQ